MAQFGNRVLTTTQDKLLPKVIDTVLDSNVFATRMLTKAKKWSGEQLKRPIKISKNTTGTSFAGFDTFSTSATDNRVRLTFDPKFYQMTVALPLTELSANDVSETKVIDLAKVEMESTAHDIADDVGTQFYGDGTGNSSKDFEGLGKIVDDGTTSATYGGLTRATYDPYLDSTVTASSGTMTLAKIDTLYDAITSGSQKPSVAYTTQAVFSLFGQLLRPQEQITKSIGMMKGEGLVGGTGFTALFYKGMPILADEKCTSGVFFMVNEDYLDWYALPVAKTEKIKFGGGTVEGNDYGEVQGLGFSWSGWIKPSNQAAVIGHIYLGGELITWNPKRHGKLTGISQI